MSAGRPRPREGIQVRLHGARHARLRRRQGRHFRPRGRASQAVSWLGIGFLKLDRCRNNEDGSAAASPTAAGPRSLSSRPTANGTTCSKACGRDIFFSMSIYAYRDWYPTNCDMARTTTDIRCRIHGGARFDGGPSSVMGVAETDGNARTWKRSRSRLPGMISVLGQGFRPGHVRKTRPGRKPRLVDEGNAPARLRAVGGVRRIG